MANVTSTRTELLRALEVDLIGPFGEDEVLALPPSRWYLTGFLAAMEARTLPEPADDDLEAGSDIEADEAAPSEGSAKVRHFLPASLGLSVLLPAAGAGPDEIVVRVSWADYQAEPVDPGDAVAVRGAHRWHWRRQGQPPITTRLQSIGCR